MNRRKAITQVGLILGGTVAGSTFFVTNGFKSSIKKVNSLFDNDQIDLMNEIAEIILPTSNTPGAKAANAGSFMALMVKDCYNEKDQKIFIEGIDKLNVHCKNKFGKQFMECKPGQRTEMLKMLDVEQKKYMEDKKSEDPNHYFRMMKELTIIAFFTSETGSTKTLRYVAVPGKYLGDVPYKKGDRAWAA